jgi:hypothetical protein
MLCATGCGKRTQPESALQQSFATEEPEVQQTIQTVTANLKAGSYAEATRALAPIVSGRPLSEPQKQAVAQALQQVSQEVAKNPALDTKEMYELRRQMFQSIRSSGRF